MAAAVIVNAGCQLDPVVPDSQLDAVNACYQITQASQIRLEISLKKHQARFVQPT